MSMHSEHSYNSSAANCLSTEHDNQDNTVAFSNYYKLFAKFMQI
jgi:hypothetical protein